jgi:hypothetical protein
MINFKLNLKFVVAGRLLLLLLAVTIRARGCASSPDVMTSHLTSNNNLKTKSPLNLLAPFKSII